jgi:hypothetical protein
MKNDRYYVPAQENLAEKTIIKKIKDFFTPQVGCGVRRYF